MDQKAAYYQRGTTLFCAGRYAEALEFFDRALECDPHAKEVLVAVASTVDRLGLSREAILCCEQAIGEDNQFCDAWFIKGLAHFRLSEYRKSCACFEQLLNNDRTHAEAWFMKGNCHYQLGELDEALCCYDETIRIRRKYPKALYNKAVALAEKGRYDEALLFYDECLGMKARSR